MPSDPVFYAVAVFAVILIGLSKGGFGGAMALLGVPLMALVVPPVQAAAILLPVLIVMDWASLWSWWRYWDTRTLVIMLPGGLFGTGIGWLLASVITEADIKLIVGTIALAFVLRYVWQTFHARRAGAHVAARPQRPVLGVIWGTVAGFTSFVAHAGGPPYQFYTLPLGHDPKVYTGTSVRYFAVVNLLKVFPYFMLGEFDRANLQTAFALLPVAVVATFAGAWLVHHMRPAIFYPFMYIMVFLTSLKLVWDGLAAVFS